MRPLKIGEAQPGMTAFFKTLDGTFIPFEIGHVQNRGSYDYLEVRRKAKSGKTFSTVGTMGNDDLWLP